METEGLDLIGLEEPEEHLPMDERGSGTLSMCLLEKLGRGVRIVIE
jgi:hypothetical protein